MSKENNQDKIDTQKVVDTVYIRGMNNDKKDGMSPLQKGVGAGLAGIMLGGLVSGCVPNEGNTPTETTPESPEATPTFKITQMPGAEAFSTLITPNNLQNLDAESRSLAESNLEYISQKCEEIYPGAVEGSEMYTLARNSSGEVTIWSMCNVREGDKEKTVILRNYMLNSAGQMPTEINQDLILLDDGTIGYEDQNFAQHTVFNIDQNNTVMVYDINGAMISTHIATDEEKNMKALLMPAQAETTPTTEVTAVVEGEVSEERKQEIVNNVNAFINAEGIYSEEELRKSPAWFELDVDETKPLPLGFLTNNHIQSILVDYQLIGEDVNLFLGTYSKEGKRIVYNFQFLKDTQTESAFTISGLANFYNVDHHVLHNLDEIKIFLDENLSKPITMPIAPYYILDDSSYTPELIEKIKSDGYDVDNFKRNYALAYSENYWNYAADLFDLVSHVEDDLKDGFIKRDNNQDVEYYSTEDKMVVEDFLELKNGKPLGVLQFLTRIQ